MSTPKFTATLIVKLPPFWTDPVEPVRLVVYKPGQHSPQSGQDIDWRLRSGKLRLGFTRQGPLQVNWGKYRIAFQLAGNFGPPSTTNQHELTLAVVYMRSIVDRVTHRPVAEDSQEYKGIDPYVRLHSKFTLEISE